MTLDQLRESIAAVVSYNWHDEEHDYCAQLPEDREGHVFEHLQRLQEFITA